MNPFSGYSLWLARHFCAMSLDDIAVRVDKTRQFIHKLETDQAAPSDALATELAKALGVLPSFFFAAHVPIPESQFHFRKLATTKPSARRVAMARGSLFQQLVIALSERVKFPEFRLTECQVSSMEDVELAAERTRSDFDLADGPIDGAVRFAELAGAVVTSFSEISGEVDALSITGTHPIIIRNETDKYSCRMRFDVGHELGHFVMHQGQQTGDRVSESQAHRFSGAFLFPRRSFVREFPVSKTGRFNWQELAQLKYRWRMSKAAIIMRAHQLELIDATQVRRAFIQLKNTGQATVEFEDKAIAIEKPEVLDKAVRLVTRHFGLSLKDIAAQIHVAPSIIEGFLSKETVAEITLPANVLRFPIAA